MDKMRFGYKLIFWITPQSIYEGIPYQSLDGGNSGNWTFLEASYYLAVTVRQLERQYGDKNINFKIAVVEQI